MKVIEVPLNEIDADSEFNCRGAITPIDVIDLAKDIEKNGLIQPVTVCLFNAVEQERTGLKWKLLVGFRRYYAHQVLKKLTIHATIHEHMDEVSARMFNLAENLQRKDLNIVQEAKAIKKLKDLGIKQEECAEKLGTSRGWVQVRFMLLELPEEVQAEFAIGAIVQGGVRELYTVLNNFGKEACFSAAKKLKDGKARGIPATVSPTKMKGTAKYHRKRQEIFKMIEHIIKHTSPSLMTRALAWCAGEITNDEFESDILLEYPSYVVKDWTRISDE